MTRPAIYPAPWLQWPKTLNDHDTRAGCRPAVVKKSCAPAHVMVPLILFFRARWKKGTITWAQKIVFICSSASHALNKLYRDTRTKLIPLIFQNRQIKSKSVKNGKNRRILYTFLNFDLKILKKLRRSIKEFSTSDKLIAFTVCGRIDLVVYNPVRIQ